MAKDTLNGISTELLKWFSALIRLYGGVTKSRSQEKAPLNLEVVSKAIKALRIFGFTYKARRYQHHNCCGPKLQIH